MKRKAPDPFPPLLDELEKLILADSKTLEKFAYSTEAIPKATLTKLMAQRKDCRVSTLRKICEGLGRELIIKVGKKI